MGRLVNRTGTFLVVGGALAAAIGVLLLRQTDLIWLPVSAIIFGVALFSSPMSKKVGWVLTGVAVVLFVVGIFV